MLTSINAANEGTFALKVEDFQDIKHRCIFMAITECVKANIEVNSLNVFSYLKMQSNCPVDIKYVMELNYVSVGDSDDMKKFIADIRHASKMKQLEQIGMQLMDKAKKEDVKAVDLQTEVMSNLNKVFADSEEKTSFSMDEGLNAFGDGDESIWDYVQKRQEEFKKGVSTLKGIPLGYDILDGMMKGLCPGHFIVVGARPGVGKTTFMCNWIYQLMRRWQTPIGFFSMEMTVDEVVGKICCIAAQVPYEELMEGRISNDTYQQFVGATMELRSMPLTIETQDSIPVSQLIARARRMIASQGIKVFFIDYLTRIKGEGKFTSKQEEVQSISKALCAFAKESKIPIVCIAQLNRDIEKNEKPRAPRKADLAQSGQIEADAHSILMLNRPDAEDPYNKPGLLEVHIVKNRFGKQGVVNFFFDGATGRFSEQKPFRKEEQDAQGFDSYIGC